MGGGEEYHELCETKMTADFIQISLYSIIVTSFWKTDQTGTLGVFHFIDPANGYTCTLHIYTVPIPVLVNLSAFLE